MNMTDSDLVSPSQALAQWLQSLAQPARLEILMVIGETEACVCHLEAALGYRQAYISQHLMALREAGIITARREGRYIYYRLADLRLLELVRMAGRVAGFSPARLLAFDQAFQSDCPCPHCGSVTPISTPARVESPEEASDAKDPVG